MKKLPSLFLILCISLISCSNNRSSTLNNKNSHIECDSSYIDENISYVDTLKQHFIPKIKGVWVLTDYINEIEKTKSPLKSRHKLEGIVTMIIDITNQFDSVEVGISWNNHEGDNFTMYFQVGQDKNRLKTNIIDYDEKSNFYELGYEIKNNITYLFLYHYDKTNKLIEKRQFSKVAEENQDNDMAFGLQYIVNKKLFSGNFTLIDGTNTKTKVKFNADGTLLGFPEFKTYYVFTDYLGAPIFLDFDMIGLRNEENGKSYAFQIVKDTIYLYSVIREETMELPSELDELKYKLIRK